MTQVESRSAAVERPGSSGADRLTEGRFARIGGRGIVVAITVGALAISLWTAARFPEPSRLAVILLLAAFYLLLATAVAEAAERRRGRGALLIYLLVQLALTTALGWQFAVLRTYAATWLLNMPLVAQAMLLLPRPLAALYTVVAVVAGSSVGLRLGGGQAFAELAVGQGAAVLFVLLFVAVAVRQAEAREESERLGEELAAANRRLARAAAEAEELATSRERNRLAREIHDSVGHYLTIAHVQLEAARAVFESDPPRALAAVETAQGATREGLAEIRRSVAALRESPLGQRSLAQALEDLVESARGEGLQARLDLLGQPRRLPPQAELTLLRSAQEGLTNVRKHAAARRAELGLDFRDPRQVRLRLEDDGLGCADPSGGFGLAGLAERAQQVGGSFRVGAAELGGLRLEVELPG